MGGSRKPGRCTALNGQPLAREGKKKKKEEAVESCAWRTRMFNARSVVNSRNKEDETRCKERAAQLLVKASKQAPGVPLARQIFFFLQKDSERFSPLGGTHPHGPFLDHPLLAWLTTPLCKDHMSLPSQHPFIPLNCDRPKTWISTVAFPPISRAFSPSFEGRGTKPSWITV